ncbi:MAG: DUF5684 domain-containing protein [Phycisphaerales bacterium]|nr:DUF5684 domain-containing protein [Phycisphaerales bacterium]
MQDNSLIDSQGGNTDTRYDGMPDMPDMSGMSDAGGGGDLAIAGGLGILIGIYLIIIIFICIGMFKMFQKGGLPGIVGLIPIVNLFFLPKLAGKPGWWGILYFIPIVSLIVAIIVWIEIAARFGRGAGTAIGLILLTPIFVCILGFGSAEYSEPGGAPVAT